MDANHLSRVFHITTGHTVTIDALTIANGLADGTSFPGNSGGGIYNDHSTLTVSNCTLAEPGQQHSHAHVEANDEIEFVFERGARFKNPFSASNRPRIRWLSPE